MLFDVVDCEDLDLEQTIARAKGRAAIFKSLDNKFGSSTTNIHPNSSSSNNRSSNLSSSSPQLNKQSSASHTDMVKITTLNNSNMSTSQYHK